MSADPTLLRLVPDTSGARVTVRAPLVHRCPHVPEVDSGVVAVVWTCGESTVELHGLAAYLTSWANVAASSEEVTAQIRADLERLDGIDEVDVHTDWTVAGMAVHVEALEGWR